jgi:hypothetical protein
MSRQQPVRHGQWPAFVAGAVISLVFYVVVTVPFFVWGGWKAGVRAGVILFGIYVYKLADIIDDYFSRTGSSNQ